MKRKKYLHLEKMFGIGCDKIDKIINGLSMPDTKFYEYVNYDTIWDELKYRDRKRVKQEVDAIDIKDGLEDDNEGSWVLRTAREIGVEHKSPKDIPTYKVGKEFFNAVKTLVKDIPYNLVYSPGRRGVEITADIAHS